MDKARNTSNIQDIVKLSYNLLLQHRVVTITKPIHVAPATDYNGWEFECEVEIPYPNMEGLPQKVSLRVLISEAFLWEPVEVFSMTDEVSGFPHQDAGSGKLCLPENDLAPQDTSRLVCYVKWAIEWLNDAAKGTLLKPGEPYELPDFSRKPLAEPIPTPSPLIFDESPNSYEIWQPHIGKSGYVKCVSFASIPALIPSSYFDENRQLIKESASFRSGYGECITVYGGRWIILPDIRYHRHRPPQTYRELVTLCNTIEVDFYSVLKDSWKSSNPYNIGILLIGFTIPEIVGEPHSEIHWQPLLFQNLGGFSAQKAGNKGLLRKPKQKWRYLREEGSFSPSEQLPWGKVENIAADRLYKRGSHSARVQSSSIACIGCGALGSSVAELLARGGVNQMNLFDFDTLKFGNLCRHSLDGSSVGVNKAMALADRLSRACPALRIKGHPVSVPLDSQTDEATRKAFAEADIVVDCTTSESAFHWLNEYACQSHKRMVSLFFDFRAELLTICISCGATSCAEVFSDLNRCIQLNETPVDPKAYYHEPSKEEQIIEGAGCWHPTFPARYADIQILSAHAVNILTKALDSQSGRGLAAIVGRRSVALETFQPGPLVELLWAKEY